MTARGVACLLGIAAIAAGALSIAGCESTQDKSRRLAREGRNRLQHQRGLLITGRNRDVKVVSTTTLHDANGSAVVVRMHSVSRRPLAQVPIAVEVDDPAGKAVYRNDAPGLETSLVQAALLPARGELWWVNDQVQPNGTPARARVLVGDARPAAGPTPRIALRGIHFAMDPVSGIAIKGLAINHSRIDQRLLVIYCVARKGKRVVAAGRAIIERLRPDKPAHFTIFFIGNPRGARLTLAAPPTGLSAKGA